MSEGVPVLRAIDNAGTDAAGDVVAFDLVFTDGRRERIAVETVLLPALVGALHQFGAFSEAVRAKLPPDLQAASLASTAPIRGSRTGRGSDGSIVLQLVRADGLPHEFRLTPEQAKEVRTNLRKAAETAPPRRT